MCLISVLYYFKMRFFKKSNYRIVKLSIEAILIIFFGLGSSLTMLGFFFPICDLIYILFMVVHIRLLKRTFLRTSTMVWKIREIIVLQVVTLLLMSYLISVLTYGKQK